MAGSLAFQADTEIRKAREWWETNRPAARLLLKQELEQAFERLVEQPESGKLRPRKRYPDLRCVVLRKTQYLLFYNYNAAKDLVLVAQNSKERQRVGDPECWLARALSFGIRATRRVIKIYPAPL